MASVSMRRAPLLGLGLGLAFALTSSPELRAQPQAGTPITPAPTVAVTSPATPVLPASAGSNTVVPAAATTAVDSGTSTGTTSAATAPVSQLSVAAVTGRVEVERLGERRILQVGDAVSERDVLHLDDDGHVALRLLRNGVLELGPHAELSIEKLPGPARSDHKSIFSLAHGYLRIAWAPSAPTPMPFYLYFSGQRATLGEGEFFFDSETDSASVCVANGRLSAMPIAGSTAHELTASACYHLMNGAEPERVAREAAAWTGMRRNFSLNAPTSPEAELAASDPSAHGGAPSVTMAAGAQTNSANASTSSAPRVSLPPAPTRPAASTSTSAAASADAPSGVPEAATKSATKPATSAATSVVKPAPVPPATTPSPSNSISAPTQPPTARPTPAPAPLPRAAPGPALPAASPSAGKPAADANSSAAKAATATGSWAINVASYADESAANKQVETLRAAGYHAAVQAIEVNARQWYRVQVRGFNSSDAAQAQLQALKTRSEYASAWVVRLQ